MNTARRMDRYLEPTSRNQSVLFASVHGSFVPPPPRMTGHVVSTSWTHRRGGAKIVEYGEKLKTISEYRKPVQKLTWKVSAPPVLKTYNESDATINSMTITDLTPKTAMNKLLVFLENRLFREATNFINRLNHDTFKLILSELPVDEFVRNMPQSLPLLEALYAKVFLSDGLNFSVRTLRPEEVVMQMTKYFAKSYENEKAIGDPSFVGSCKKLLKVILLSDSKVRKSVYQKKKMLNKTIEGLGHHGLVGTSDESLTNLHDALKKEFEKVVHSYKEAIHKLDDLALSSKKSVSNGPAPIEASHQRQLSLNQEEIQGRLIKNKTLLNVVEPTLSNHSLDLFLGILQRRIEHDKDALFQHTQLRKEMKENGDGPIANLLMRYSFGCEKVLELMKEVSVDFDCDDDSSDVSGYHSDSDSVIMMATGNSPFVSKAARANFLTRSVRNLDRIGARNSLILNVSDPTSSNVQPEKDSSSVSSSSSCSEDIKGQRTRSDIANGFMTKCERCQQRDSVIIQIPSNSSDQSATIANFHTEIEKLRIELEKTRCQLSLVQERETKLRDRLAAQAKSMSDRNTTPRYDMISDGERMSSALIRRYGNLYAQARVDTMDALDRLDYLTNNEELKTKLLFSVIVLAYRSASARSNLIKDHIKRVLQIKTSDSKDVIQGNGPPVPPPLPDKPIGSRLLQASEARLPESRKSLISKTDTKTDMETSIEIYLRRTADEFDLGKCIEEVTSQIYATLYDYPCLKESNDLLNYIEECLRLSWNLVNQTPPFALEYEARIFDPNLHVRFHDSNPRQNSIKTYLWPALQKGPNGPCVHKAVVLT
ncbi:uncharacterized protein LOC136027141 [Artemia franciscana]|uniref:Mitochondria-eating protein n=1 Tax=Artemia franciscana TaxID=6661 RepID=A0AA88KYE1_ARTSF|nr:hypothetical protein QYM36_013065 [Artemia franciscana]